MSFHNNEPLLDNDYTNAIIKKTLLQWIDQQIFPLLFDRIDGVSQLATLTATHLGVNVALVLAKIQMLISAFDDLCDVTVRSTDELFRHTYGLRNALFNANHGSQNPLENMLIECISILSQFKNYKQYQYRWIGSIEQTIASMENELPLKSNEIIACGSSDECLKFEYMVDAVHTIGGISWGISLLIVHEKEDHSKYLFESFYAFKILSLIVRLANDKQTHVKEDIEGKINLFNIPKTRNVDEIDHLLISFQTRYLNLIKKITLHDEILGSYLKELMIFTVKFYETRDFITSSSLNYDSSPK